MKIRNTARTIIRDASGRVLLLRRAADDDHRPGEWDLPGGGVEEQETPLATALRETAEEAGVVLSERGVRLVYMVTALAHDKRASANRFVFAARVPDGQSVTLSREHSEYAWLPMNDALQELTHPTLSIALRYAFENELLEC